MMGYDGNACSKIANEFKGLGLYRGNLLISLAICRVLFKENLTGCGWREKLQAFARKPANLREESHLCEQIAKYSFKQIVGWCKLDCWLARGS